MSRLSIACLLVALLDAGAHAAPSRSTQTAPRWVIFVHVEGPVPGAWSESLRHTVEESSPERTWLPSPALGADELRGTLGCAAWDAACAAAAASVLGANHALMVDVVAADEHTATITVTAVERADAAARAAERIEVPLHEDGLSVARRWLGGVIRGARPTVVIVQSDLPGTEVFLDGVSVGVTPLTLIDVVAPGRHALELRREGRAPLREHIDVKPGALLRVSKALAQGPAMRSTPTVGETAPMPLFQGAPGGSTTSVALVGYGLGGAGIIVGAVGVAIAANAVATLGRLFSTSPDGSATTRPGICEGPDDTFLAPGCRSPMTPQEIDDDLFLENRAPNPASRIAAFRAHLEDTVQVGVAVAVAGVLVGATGAALAFGVASGEVQDEGLARSDQARNMP